VKRWLIICLVSLVILLSACGENSLPSSPAAGNAIESSHAIQQVNGYANRKIDFNLEKDCYLSTIKWIDDDALLLIVSNYQHDGKDQYKYSKIYYMNMLDNSSKEIYDGIFYGDPITIRLKFMKDGNLGLIGYNTFLLIDKNNFRVKHVTQYPDNYFSCDVSSDGNRLVYLDDKDSLILSDIEFRHPILLIDKDPISSSSIRWSPDDKEILFSSFAEESKICILNAETKALKQFAFADSVLLMGHWFSDSSRVLVISNTASDNPQACLSILDKSKGELTTMALSGFPAILENPNNNTVLYKAEIEATETDYDQYCLNLLDLSTQNSIKITPDFMDITSWALSRSGKSIAYNGQTGPGNLNLYIIQK
jgi:hypothetical protein